MSLSATFLSPNLRECLANFGRPRGFAPPSSICLFFRGDRALFKSFKKLNFILRVKSYGTIKSGSIAENSILAKMALNVRRNLDGLEASHPYQVYTHFWGDRKLFKSFKFKNFIERVKSYGHLKLGFPAGFSRTSTIFTLKIFFLRIGQKMPKSPWNYQIMLY